MKVLSVSICFWLIIAPSDRMGSLMRHKNIVMFVLALLFVAACGEPEDNRPGKPVASRRAAFAKMLRAFEPMGVKLRKGQYDVAQFSAHAKELVAVRDLPWQHFGPDTNYPPSHAKDRVWAEAALFETKRQAFFEASDRLLKATDGGDVKLVTQAYESVHETCRDCHKAFKD